MTDTSNFDGIVCLSLFMFINGNYLKSSAKKVGIEVDNVPQANPSKTNFSHNGYIAKSWTEIWGAGQRIGVLEDVVLRACFGC